MSIFGGGKKQTRKLDPESKEKPDEHVPRKRLFMASVDRKRPTSYRDVTTGGDIKAGGFRDLRTYSELKEMVQIWAGGGDYMATARDQEEGHVIDKQSFTLNGVPKVNGKDIPPPETKSSKKEEEDDPIVKERKAMELAKVRAEREKVERQLKRDAEAETLSEDDIDDDVIPEEPAGQSMEMMAMREELARMREERDRDKREWEEQREREKREREEAARKKEMDDLKASVEEMRQSRSKSSADSTVALMVEMMRESRESQKSSFEAMMKKSDQTMQMMMEQVNRISEMRGEQADHTLRLIQETWVTAAAAQQGKMPGDDEDDEDKTPLGMLANVASKVADLIAAKMSASGVDDSDMTPEQKQQIVDSAIAKVRAEHAQLPPPETPRVEVSPAQPVRPQPAPGAQVTPPTRPSVSPIAKTSTVDQRRAIILNVRKQIDSVMRTAIAEIKTRGLDIENPQWYMQALKLPKKIVKELDAASTDLNSLMTVLAKYGSGELVKALSNTIEERKRLDMQGELAPSTPQPEQPPVPPAPLPPKASKKKREKKGGTLDLEDSEKKAAPKKEEKPKELKKPEKKEEPAEDKGKK